MKTTGNTVLITGGSAGIGFEIARLFTEKGNRVIITGRDETRLRGAAAQLPGATALVSDVGSEADVNALVGRLQADFGDLNVVVNNAGRAFVYDLTDPAAGAFNKAAEEMHTNYLSVIRLNEKLLPLLKQQPAAALVHVSSIVAFVPGPLVTYAASKAALHSYTQALRVVLEDTSAVKVFELMPPLVDTGFSREIGGASGLPPRAVAEALLAGLEKDQYEIRVGATEQVYQLYRTSPEDALRAMFASRKRAKAQND